MGDLGEEEFDEDFSVSWAIITDSSIWGSTVDVPLDEGESLDFCFDLAFFDEPLLTLEFFFDPKRFNGFVDFSVSTVGGLSS